MNGATIVILTDASGDEPAQFIGAGISSHLETGAHDCRFGRV